MKAKFTVVILVLISNLVFSQVNQSALSKAKHAMALKDYNSAINWGLTDMSNQPSRYTAYLLAYAYFQVNKYDKAAYYGGISIGDQIIIPGETINNVKKGQLKQIVDYYAKLNNFNQQQITSTLYSHYVNKESIIINFSLSEGQNTTHNLDLEGAKQQQRQRDSTLQARHVSLITLSGGSNPESARGFLEALADSGAHIYTIFWTDSTQITSGNIGTYPTKYIEYSPDKFPELYDRREILVPDFIPLYASYRQGIVDANNISVQRYELNRYNFDLFIKQVFPEIYEQKNSLKDFFKEFKWE